MDLAVGEEEEYVRNGENACIATNMQMYVCNSDEGKLLCCVWRRRRRRRH